MPRRFAGAAAVEKRQRWSAVESRSRASSMSAPGPAKLSRMNRPPSTVSKSMPGATRDAGAGQQVVGEGHRVVGEVPDVGVHVEGAVGGRQLGDAEPRQPVEEEPAVVGVPRDVAVELGVRRVAEGREARPLSEHRRADREVAGEHVDRAAQPVGDQHPADPPAGHREVLGEAGRRRPPRGWSPRRCAPAGSPPSERGVLDAVVDLVGDQLDLLGLAVGRERGQLARAAASCRSGWPGWRRPGP